MFETTSDFVFAGERHQMVSDIPQPTTLFNSKNDGGISPHNHQRVVYKMIESKPWIHMYYSKNNHEFDSP